jgi:D-serine deaminase-like pyridoxal phosphate-dependent protein
LKPLITAVLASPHLVLVGFYSHAGDAYGARDGASAADFLRIEMLAVQTAGELARTAAAELGLPERALVFSVGSTPTASASTLLANGILPPTLPNRDIRAGLTTHRIGVRGGRLEIHAGVYPLLDLQQLATGLHNAPNLALSIVARVCSVYTLRSPPQVLVDAGAIAFSKDTGPNGGYGEVHKGRLVGWRVSKISQVLGQLASDARGAYWCAGRNMAYLTRHST